MHAREAIPFPARTKMHSYDLEDTSIIYPREIISLSGRAGPKAGMQQARGLTSFSAVRRINKRRRTVSGPVSRDPRL